MNRRSLFTGRLRDLTLYPAQSPFILAYTFRLSLPYFPLSLYMLLYTHIKKHFDLDRAHAIPPFWIYQLRMHLLKCACAVKPARACGNETYSSSGDFGNDSRDCQYVRNLREFPIVIWKKRLYIYIYIQIYVVFYKMF